MTQCFLPRVQPFQTFSLVHGRIAVQSINMNFCSGSRDCTFSPQIWAEIGQVPPKQVFRCYLARYCSQTTLGHIRSICVVSRWIGLRPFELNLQRESRELITSTQKSARNPTFAAKSGILLISFKIMLPDPDRTNSFDYFYPKMSRCEVDRTELTGCVEKSPLFFSKCRQNSTSTAQRQHLTIILKNKRSRPGYYQFARPPWSLGGL